MRNIRTRVVNFRVTDEEFEQLKTASDQEGARCLSDFARSSMLDRPTVRAAHEPVDERMSQLDRRLSTIERSMARLVEALAGSKGQSVGADR